MAVTPDQLEREILALKPFFSDNTAIYMTGSHPFVKKREFAAPKGEPS